MRKFLLPLALIALVGVGPVALRAEQPKLLRAPVVPALPVRQAGNHSDDASQTRFAKEATDETAADNAQQVDTTACADEATCTDDGNCGGCVGSCTVAGSNSRGGVCRRSGKRAGAGRGIMNRVRWLSAGRGGSASFCGNCLRRLCGGCGCCCSHNPPPGDMIYHIPYQTWRMYYYYRPYQAAHVEQHLHGFPGSQRHIAQPYANDVFADLHRSIAANVVRGEALEYADAIRPPTDPGFYNRVDAGHEVREVIPENELLPQGEVIFDSMTGGEPKLVPSEPMPADPFESEPESE